MVTKACTHSTTPQLPINLPYYACVVNPYLAPSTFATCCSGPIINATTLSDLADDASCAAYCPVTDDASNPANPYGFSDFYMCLFSPPSVWGVKIDGYCLPPVNVTDRVPRTFDAVGSDIRGEYTSMHGMPTTVTATATAGESSSKGPSTTTAVGESATSLGTTASKSTASTTGTTNPVTTGSDGLHSSPSAEASPTRSVSGGKASGQNLSLGVFISIILSLMIVTSL